MKPHPRNPREHPKPGSPVWRVLKKSVEHDYFDPILWNERNGCLVSGHFRRKVMESIGIVEIDVSVVDHDEPLIAAEQLGRRCVATELDPKYCAVILERLTGAGLTATKLHGPHG